MLESSAHPRASESHISQERELVIRAREEKSDFVSVGRPKHIFEHQVHAEVREKVGAGLGEITDEAAVTIASWWAGPDSPQFTMLSQIGKASVEILLEEICKARRLNDVTLELAPGEADNDAKALDMLATWAINHPSRKLDHQ